MPSKVIAIDFDGCICENNWPNIGMPNWNVINQAKAERQNGAKLILWTCREGERLTEAVKACADWGLTFDAVNDNLESAKAEWGNNSRKIGATEYWDDKAVRMDKSFIPLTVDKKITRQKLTGLQRSRKKDE